MESDNRRFPVERRKLFRIFTFLERRALGRERRRDAKDLFGEPIPTWEAMAPVADQRPYPAEI
jgi:hypothetical protein